MIYIVAVMTVVGVALLLPWLYLAMLTVAGMFARSRRAEEREPITRFAVMVPAHDEEKLLPHLLESLNKVDYPRKLVDVYVVADNCEDSTAQIAANYGTSVFERSDEKLRGKPYALRWLFDRIHEKRIEYDAYMIVDADSLVSRNFMRVMDARFQDGAQVVQGYYTVSNADESPVASLRYAALALMHYVRPLGRKALGLSCGLFGTGMAFRRDVIENHGWDSYTLAEDVEYFMKLTSHGIKVEFAPEAVLRAQMPTTLKGAKSQNLRWERGRLSMAKTYGIPYVIKGLLKGNLVMADAGIQQIIPPVSVSALSVVLFAIASAFTGSYTLIGLSIAMLAAMFTHLVLGLVLARAPGRVYKAFLYAPLFVAWKLVVYIEAMLPKRMSWERTQRS